MIKNTFLSAKLLIFITSLLSFTSNLGAQALFPAVQELAGPKLEWRTLTANRDFFPCQDFPTKGTCIPPNDPDGREEKIAPANDSVLFNALLCYSGEKKGCAAVKNSQEMKDGAYSEVGRFRRSPYHVGRPENSSSKTQTFSKDHVLGVLLYLAHTKDTSALGWWWRYMIKNSIEQTLDLGEELKASAVDCSKTFITCLTGNLEKVITGSVGCTLQIITFQGTSCAKKPAQEVVKKATMPIPRACDHADCALTPQLLSMLFSLWGTCSELTASLKS